jgi:hypothetical protein
MAVIQVDVVGAEPAQAGLQGTGQVQPGQAPVVGAGSLRHESFGCEDHLVATAAQRPAEDLLGLTAAVHVGGIDEIPASGQEPVNDLPGLGLIAGSESAAGTEVHRAQAGTGHLQARPAHVHVLHWCAPPFCASYIWNLRSTY